MSRHDDTDVNQTEAAEPSDCRQPCALYLPVCVCGGGEELVREQTGSEGRSFLNCSLHDSCAATCLTPFCFLTLMQRLI